MNYEVIISSRAELDLRDIYEYIALEIGAPENATGQIDRLETGILSLQRFPDRYRMYAQEPWQSRGLRVLSVDNFVIFYISNKNKKTVTVIRVVYGGRDIKSLLDEML